MKNPDDIYVKYIGNENKKIKIVYKKEVDTDLCVINFFYKIPMILEKNNVGIGYFISKMLLKGSKINNLDATNFALELEKNAIFLDCSRTTEYINFTLTFLKENFKKAIDLFFSAMNYPSFDENEINKLKLEFKNALKSKSERISKVCYDEFLKHLFGKNNPKSWDYLGDEKSIENFNLEKIQDFHENFFINQIYFKENIPLISIIGNFNNEKIYELNNENFIEYIYTKFFENIKEKNIKLDYSFEEININNQKKHELKKDFQQAYIIMGSFAPSILDKNWNKLKLLNNFIGGGMSSLLFDKIREELGLVYEIGSFFSSYSTQNFWAVRLGLDKKNIDFAIAEIKKEIKNFCKNKLSQKDLDILKEKTKRFEIFKKQRKADRCFFIGLYEFLGLEYDYSEKYLEAVEKINLTEINLSIENLFNADEFVISVIK
jgi:predicted Zn-dependent peptidase